MEEKKEQFLILRPSDRVILYKSKNFKGNIIVSFFNDDNTKEQFLISKDNLDLKKIDKKLRKFEVTSINLIEDTVFVNLDKIKKGEKNERRK